MSTEPKKDPTCAGETPSQPSCEERIQERLDSRLEQWLPDFDDMTEEQCKEMAQDFGFNLSTDPEDYDMTQDHMDEVYLDDLREECRQEWQDRAYESILGVSKSISYRVELSCGGPQDYFILRWDPEGKYWEGGSYHFLDWFDGAQRSINAETAERLAEAFGLYPDEEC